jgi:anti-anti-sigma factor
VSHPRHPSSPVAEPATSHDLNAPDSGAALLTSATVTGYDGTVLVTITRRTEHPTEPPAEPPAADHRGGAGDASLVVVDVVGDLDADTAPLLHVALTQAIGHHPRVCCDLSRVEFLGAAAVNTMFAALRDADDTGCAFTVRGVHGFSPCVFRITGLDVVLAARA